MKRNSEEFKIGDVTFVINELTVNDMLPMMERMQKDQAAAQKEMVGKSVYINGAPIGSDEVGSMGISIYMQIVKRVLRVNGLDNEGNG
jgi:hypothetical protein